MSKEKVVLAYSGGLDTTAIIPWLKETYDYDVVCCCVDCGQGEELDGLEERALYSGASKLYIEDITDDFCENYIMPCVQADAVYENKYLLGFTPCMEHIAVIQPQGFCGYNNFICFSNNTIVMFPELIDIPSTWSKTRVQTSD